MRCLFDMHNALMIQIGCNFKLALTMDNNTKDDMDHLNLGGMRKISKFTLLGI